MNYKQKYLKYKLKYLNLKKKMFGGMESGIYNTELAERILTYHKTLSPRELAEELIDDADGWYENIKDYFNEYRKTLEKIGEADENFEEEMVDKLEKSINIVIDTYAKDKETQDKKVKKAKQKAKKSRMEANKAVEISYTKESEAEAAEKAAVSAAEIFSSATGALMTTIAKPLLEKAVAGENKTIVDGSRGSDGSRDYDDFDGSDGSRGYDGSDSYSDYDDFDGSDSSRGYDDYDPNAYEVASEGEDFSDCYDKS